MSLVAEHGDVERAQAGDRSAYGRLVRKFHSRVLGVLLARGSDPARAEELAQEVFLTAWRLLPTLRDPGSVGRWLCGIAANKARHQQRSLARVRQRERSLLVAACCDPTASRREDIRSCMAQLSEADRQLLWSVYWEGQTALQVAARLDVSEAAVRQRLVRARQRLRAVWQRDGPIEQRSFFAALYATLTSLPTAATSAGSAVGACSVAAATVLVLFVASVSNAPAAETPSVGVEAPSAPVATVVPSPPESVKEPAPVVELSGEETADVADAATHAEPWVWVVEPSAAENKLDAKRLAKGIRRYVSKDAVELESDLPLDASVLLFHPHEDIVDLPETTRSVLRQHAIAGKVYVALPSGLRVRDLWVWGWSERSDSLVMVHRGRFPAPRDDIRSVALWVPWPNHHDYPALVDKHGGRLVETIGRREIVHARPAEEARAELLESLMLRPYETIHDQPLPGIVAPLVEVAAANPGREVYVCVHVPSDRHPSVWRWDGSSLRRLDGRRRY